MFPRSIGAALVLFSVCCQAQIRELATTHSGDQLYFTSLLGLPDAEFLPHPKIMRWTASNGFEIFAQRANQRNLGQGLSNPYQLTHANVSGDGSVVTFAGQRDCYVFFRGCLVPNPPRTSFLTGGQETVLDGRYQLSPNGRFALRSFAATALADYALLDLKTGTSANLPDNIGVEGWGAVTNDGRVVFARDGVIHLWSPGNDLQFTVDVPAYSGIVSADGRFIIYSHWEFETKTMTLHSLVTETGATTLIHPAGTGAKISEDGTFLTFLGPATGSSKRQLFVARPDASDVWQITDYPEGVREAVLSGDGRVVFLVTETTRLLRYEVNSGDMQELSPRVAWVGRDFIGGARGSTVTIDGSGLSDGVAEGTYPLPSFLAGARVEADGIPLLIVSAEPHRIVAQIPFEMTAGIKTLKVVFPDGPLRTTSARLAVADFQPNWQTGSSQSALHSDLTRRVTFDDPARPGELIHFLLTGLGEVTPPIPSGVPAPSQPELRVARAFQCVLRGSRSEAINLEVVKAILMPGTFGSYHVTVRAPEGGLLTPYANGTFLGTISFEPADPVAGVFTGGYAWLPFKP